jgi:flagellar biosynthesis protein FlhG
VKPLSEQDYYETLEIPQDASPEDVARAYHLALSTYAEGSLAGHSVFSEGDVEVIRERIEMAYQALSDPELRVAYDAQLARQREEEHERPAPPDPAALAVAVSSAVDSVESLESLELDELDDEDGEFDGPRLRRVRLRNGVDLDQIAAVTKVNPTYLRFIEEERFDDLPAAVYVRGFVKGYASCVGLDPERVAKSYMQRCERNRESPKQRSIFSRR